MSDERCFTYQGHAPYIRDTVAIMRRANLPPVAFPLRSLRHEIPPFPTYQTVGMTVIRMVFYIRTTNIGIGPNPGPTDGVNHPPEVRHDRMGGRCWVFGPDRPRPMGCRAEMPGHPLLLLVLTDLLDLEYPLKDPILLIGKGVSAFFISTPCVSSDRFISRSRSSISRPV